MTFSLNLQYLYLPSSGLVIRDAVCQYFLYTWVKKTLLFIGMKNRLLLWQNMYLVVFLILAAEYTAVSGFEIIIVDRWNLVLDCFFPDRCDHSKQFCFMSLSTLWKGTPVTWCCYKIYLSLKSYSQYQNKLHGINMIFNFK